MIRKYPEAKVEDFFLKIKPINFFGQMFTKLKNKKFLSLLPENNEIPGWFKDRVTKLEKNHQRFSRYPLELLTCGAAQGVIQKYVTDTHRSAFLEIALYDMRNRINATRIYNKLSIKTEKQWPIDTSAAEARVDDSRLFTYLIDFRKEHYFVRIIAGGKNLNSLKTGKQFAQTISTRIGRSL